MAKLVPYFEDERGKPHKKLEDAIMSDIAALLGRQGENGDLSIGIAQRIVAQREGIVAALAQLDALSAVPEGQSSQPGDSA